jgi:polyketide synthase PksJ
MRLIVGYREADLHGFGLRDVFQYETVAETAAFFESRERRGGDADGVLSVLRSDPAASVRILLLPFACGNASSFIDLSRHLDGRCEIVAANPGDAETETVPGISMLGEQIVDALATNQHLPLFVVGYSYGGYLAYEVVRRLERAGQPARGVVVIASTPPGVRTEIDMIIRASDEEILAYSREIYDFDSDLLSEQEKARYLWLLREQTRTMGDYAFDDDRPLATPALILVGEDEEDRELIRESERWFGLFKHGEFDTIPGRHMLIKTHPAELAKRINALIETLLERIATSAAQ